MEVYQETPISAHKASRMMHLFTKDPFIEENYDPELAKTLTMICTSIEAASFDIQIPEQKGENKYNTFQENNEQYQDNENEGDDKTENIQENIQDNSQYIQENQEPVQDESKHHHRKRHRKPEE